MISESMVAFIRSLPERRELTRGDLLVDALKLSEETSKGLVVYDAPFGWINEDARVALIGVTPGFTQMQIAFQAVRRHLIAGKSQEDACRLVKYEASFAGSMRTNLIRMLEELEMHEILGLSSPGDLFGTASHLLHTTSAVRFPTFLDGRNYTGSRPPILRSPFLMRYVREILAPELSSLQSAVFIPLGKSVGGVLAVLEEEGLIPDGRTLYGFPHPSGANGHRERQFAEAKSQLAKRLRAVLGSSPHSTISP